MTEFLEIASLDRVESCGPQKDARVSETNRKVMK